MYFKGIARELFRNKMQRRGWGFIYPRLAFILRFQDILFLQPNSGFRVAGIEWIITEGCPNVMLVFS